MTPALIERETKDWLASDRSDVVEVCARELEWMARGSAAHECAVLHAAAKRLRDEATKIVLRASGVAV